MKNIFQELIEILGEHDCHFDLNIISKYLRNVSNVNRDILGVLTPNNTEQIKQIIQLANERKFTLYPISSGRNWGLGSKLPVSENSFILDLSKNNKIIEVNSDYGYALIESGVTQIQLFNYLQENNLPFIFNITGSGKDTSIAGNALERGVGYFSSKADNICGMEIISGKGEIIKTGFSNFPNAKAQYLYKYGIGPSIDGLFFQSNFGIVTKIAIELIPKREIHAALLISIENPDYFEKLVDDLKTLKKNVFPYSATHIANRNRSRITLEPILYDLIGKHYKNLSNKQKIDLSKKIFSESSNNCWTTITGVMGSKIQISETLKITRNLVGRYAKVSLITEGKISFLKKLFSLLSYNNHFKNKLISVKSIEPLFNYCKGVPSDASLASVLWPQGIIIGNDMNPDSYEAGLLYTLPIIPLRGNILLEIDSIVNSEFEKFGFIPYSTYNIVNSNCLESVINLSFNKNDKEESALAHACIHSVNEVLMKKGIYPYRMGIYNMNQIVDNENDFWKLTKDLKLTFDPNNVISPLRYNSI